MQHAPLGANQIQYRRWGFEGIERVGLFFSFLPRCLRYQRLRVRRNLPDQSIRRRMRLLRNLQRIYRKVRHRGRERRSRSRYEFASPK